MSRTVAGTLYLPDGSVTGTGVLKFITHSTWETVLEGSTSTTTVAANGSYSITLQEGKFLCYFTRTNCNEVYLGSITVETGTSISLNDLLMASTLLVPADVRTYVDNVVSPAVAQIYTDLSDYATSGYDPADQPTGASALILTQLNDLTQPAPKFGIRADWTAGTSVLGNSLEYVLRWGTSVRKMDSIYGITGVTATINNLKAGETYVVEVYTYDVGDKLIPAATYLIDSLEIISPVVSPIDLDDVTLASGVELISINWINPSDVPFAKTRIYISDDADVFPLNSTTQIYYGSAESYLYHTQSSTPYFFKFITENTVGTRSAATLPTDPITILDIDSSSVGRLVGIGQLEAQHIADGAITADKLMANTIVAGKLAVLDLTNLAENGNFSLYSGSSVYPSWTATGGGITSSAAGSITLASATELTNGYKFSCGYNDKFYAAAKLTWSSSAGAGNKGIQIVWYDVDDVELSAEYVTITGESPANNPNTDTVAATDVLVEGFARAPLNATTGAIRIKIEGVTTSITIKDVVCRTGASVLIDNGEITADKLVVYDIFALELTIGTGGSIKVGDDPETTGGIRLSKASGFQAFETGGGDPTISITPAGNATFNGNLAAATIGSSAVTTSTLIIGGSGAKGKIYTAGKTEFDDATDGVFLGWDDGLNKQTMGIGNATDYVRWNGSTLAIKGNITATSGTFTGTVYASAGSFSGAITATSGSITGNLSVGAALVIGTGGKIYSTGKTSYGSATKGFYLEQATNGRMHLGDNTNFVKWDGSNLDVLRSGVLASNTVNYTTSDGQFLVYSNVGQTLTYLIDTGITLSEYSATLAGVALEARAMITGVSIVHSGSGHADAAHLYASAEISTYSMASNLSVISANSGKIYLKIVLTGVPGCAGIVHCYLTQYKWALKKLL